MAGRPARGPLDPSPGDREAVLAARWRRLRGGLPSALYLLAWALALVVVLVALGWLLSKVVHDDGIGRADSTSHSGRNRSAIAGIVWEVLTAIAGACRDQQRLRFDYRDHDGSASIRTVEPHCLAHDRGRWCLVAWTPTGKSGAPSVPTASDPASRPVRGLRPASYPAATSRPTCCGAWGRRCGATGPG